MSRKSTFSFHLYWAVLCHISSLQLLSLTKHSSAMVSSASSLQSRQSSSEVIVSLPWARPPDIEVRVSLPVLTASVLENTSHVISLDQSEASIQVT